MARGNWRNWEEVECPKCKNRMYKKYVKNNKCSICGEKMKEEENGKNTRLK